MRPDNLSPCLATPIANNDFSWLRSLWKNKKDSANSFSIKSGAIVKAHYCLALNRYKRVSQPLKNNIQLGEIFDITIGETPSKSNTHFYDGKHLFVKIKDMQKPFIKNTIDILTDKGVEQSRVKPLKRHTLESIAGLIPKDQRVLSQYPYDILPHLDYSPYVNRGAKGQEMNKNTLKTIQIPLPLLHVQKRLVRALAFQQAKKEHDLKQGQKIKALIP